MRITWWGHSTCTVQFDVAQVGRVRVLTDPVLTARVAHLSRPGSAVPPADAARADVVVISHLHADHLHVPSLRLLPAGVRIIAPRGARAVLRRRPELAERIDEVVIGDELVVSGVRVRAVTAAHDGRRLPVSRHVGPALGFVLAESGRGSESSLWFAGDTGLFDAMSDIGPVDAALVPVGGWGPTLGPEHLDPVQAAEAVRRVGARDAVPVHFGTLWPTGLRRVAPRQFQRKCREPGRQFADALAGSGASAHVLGPGGSVEVGRR